MFDDPQKELKRLEEQLLKTETDDDFEQFYQDIFEEFGSGEEESAPRAVAPKKNANTYADAPRAVAPKKKKGVKGLVITICLELIGIAAVVLWWAAQLL